MSQSSTRTGHDAPRRHRRLFPNSSRPATLLTTRRQAHRSPIRRAATTLMAAACTGALLLTGTAVNAHADPSPSPSSASSRSASPSSPGSTGTCTPDRKLSVFSFNGFQGRIANAAQLFTPVTRERTRVGADHVLLLSAGDNVGGSTFASAAQGDLPALDILKAAKVDASTLGNHELDRGFADLRDRIIPHVDGDFPYLGANVRNSSTRTIASPLSASTIIDRGGVKVGVVGAVTRNLGSLVAPAGISGLAVSDPVSAVNAEAARLRRSGADIVVAGYHESAGGTVSAPSPKSPDFTPIVERTSRDVDIVFTGHTDRQYSWRTRSGAPLMQAGAYGDGLAKVLIGYDSTRRKICATTPSIVPAAARADTSDPTISAIGTLASDAAAEAEVAGQQRIGSASSPVTTASDAEDRSYGDEVRNRESTLSNMVAQMYKDTLGRSDPNFIGLQNPGGTRASLLRSRVTYRDAAQVLPFANTLATRKVTGQQLRRVLEQQWRTGAGATSRPYLQLGLSSNLTYSYDESRPRGGRVTSVWVNGRPLNPRGTYTVGSGTFLIDGGDGFSELARGARPVNTGKVDLESWVNWIRARRVLEPSFAKQGVSLSSSIPAGGGSARFVLGMPGRGAQAPDTVDLTSREAARNTSVTAYLVQKGRKVKVATAPVRRGSAAVNFSVPAAQGLSSGDAVVRFEFPTTGTVARFPMRITVPTAPSRAPSGEATSPTPTPTASDPTTSVPVIGTSGGAAPAGGEPTTPLRAAGSA